MHARTRVGIMWVTLSIAAVASAGELWRQDPINSCGGLSSQDARNPGGLGWFSEVADNFAAESGWCVRSIEFWGGYCSAADDIGNTEGFTIRFYTDDNGSPGTRIYEEDVFAFTETPYAMLGDLVGYHYTLDLNVPFEPPSAGQYWISVVAILARGGGANEPQWGWVDAVSVNPPPAHQWFFDPGNFQPQNNDVAFVLLGEASGGCATCDPCDANCDGAVDAFDIEPFIDLIFGGGTPCSPCAGDTSGDGTLDAFDIEPFVACLFGP